MDPNSPIDLCGLALILWVAAFLTISAIQSGPVDVDVRGWRPAPREFVLAPAQRPDIRRASPTWPLGIASTGQGRRQPSGSVSNGPACKTILISLGMVIPCYIVAIIGNVLTLIFQPDVFDNLQDTMEDMTTGLDNPVGMILIGLSAGIGEEVLFRGAVQPRFGIVIAALFWTAMHAQYDVSFVLVGLFGVGMILGLQRKYFGTASAIITHAVYNMIAVAITMRAVNPLVLTAAGVPRFADPNT